LIAVQHHKSILQVANMGPSIYVTSKGEIIYMILDAYEDAKIVEVSF